MIRLASILVTGFNWLCCMFIFMAVATCCYGADASNNDEQLMLSSVLPQNAIKSTSTVDFFKAGIDCYKGTLPAVTYIYFNHAALFFSNDYKKNCILSKLILTPTPNKKPGGTCIIDDTYSKLLFTQSSLDALKNYDYDNTKKNNIITKLRVLVFLCFANEPLTLDQIAAILKAPPRPQNPRESASIPQR